MIPDKICIQFIFILYTTLDQVMADKPTILLTNPTIPSGGTNLLIEKGYNVKIASNNRTDILQKIPGVDALWWASGVKLDTEIIDAAGPKLKMVGVNSAGYNHIDVAELKKRGIKASNTPGVLNDAVADLAILLTLAAGRRVTEARWAIENNEWDQSDWKWMLGRDVRNSTVGIFGLGGIGMTIAKRFKGFDLKEILYTGHKEKPYASELGAKFVDKKTLLEQSDFVIVVVPLTEETRGMCNEEFFKTMKKTGVFVNVSRGQVVDQQALINALKNKEIFAAGLDVTVPEPIPGDHELMKLPNVVVLPHIGSATNNTRENMSILVAQNIIKGLSGEDLITPIA